MTLSNSGPLGGWTNGSCGVILVFWRYVFITPHKYADLLDTCSKLLSRNWERTPRAESTGNSFKASNALVSKSECANLPEIKKII